MYAQVSAVLGIGVEAGQLYEMAEALTKLRLDATQLQHVTNVGC